jgi:hypothetical protein
MFASVRLILLKRWEIQENNIFKRPCFYVLVFGTEKFVK